MIGEEFDGTDNTEGEENRPGYFTVQGYAWYAYPTTEIAPPTPYDLHQPDDINKRNVNYSGSVGETTGLLNEPHEGAYLVVTSTETRPRVFDGWEVEPANLDYDFEAKHTIGTIRLVRELKQKHPDLEPFKQYEFEGWD
jgi:hypothetical protein